MVARTAKISAINSVAQPSSAAQREETSHGAYEQFLNEELGKSKRELMGMVAMLAVSGALGYATTHVVTWLMLATLLMTGSAFLSFMIWFMGMILGLMAAVTIGARVQRIIVDGSLDRTISQASSAAVAKTSVWYNNASGAVTSLFNRKEVTL